MAQCGWETIVNVDVSAKVVADVSQRAFSLESKAMEFVEDDATQLKSFRDNSVHAVMDKGLVDALFCADVEQVRRVMKSVGRILVPGGLFCFYSYSRPEFLLEWTVDGSNTRKNNVWKDVQVLELDSILMYRFQKLETKKIDSRRQRKKERHHRRRPRA